MHIHYVYITVQLVITAFLLDAVSTQEVEIQYTAVRVHVPGTRVHIISYQAHTLQQQTATAVLVLQLLVLSAAACFTLYTAVWIKVCRYCWT